ncbi:MAG TPA: putative Ig domain-containing protein [Verrucomicrobiae bacterium]|nr:putative Ig domain-containing protein [Verrucomicrobiae bacterium]
MKVLVTIFSCVACLSTASAFSPDTNLTAREQQIVAAAAPAQVPQFHGPQIMGIRPDETPLLFCLAATGDRPLQFSAKRLPDGLSLDPQSGIITGKLGHGGTYTFTAMARNSEGTAKTKITIACDDTLALTPPMGWNSYDAFGDSVMESEVVSNATWLAKHLQPFGWDTVVVDFRWYDSLADGVRVQNPEGVTIDAFGRCIPPTNRFPSATGGAGFKNLANQLHAMGLKFGIHIMRGIPRKAVEQNLPIAGSSFTTAQAVLPKDDLNRTCIWNRDMFGVDATTEAGKAWYNSIAKQYAEWGVDYIKCDDIANMFRGRTYESNEIAALSSALEQSGRSIVLSLSPGPAPVDCTAHLQRFANLWRISNDFWDNWKSLNHNFDLFGQWYQHGIPGHWPDGDMIPFGHICQRNCDVHPGRWTRFTHDEQLTLMSLWALAPSPLMLGANLPDNDEWTTALLTNPEVLAVNQDVLGQQGCRRGITPSGAEIWTKKLAAGSLAVGFFNRSEKTIALDYRWRELGIKGSPKVRDLWIRQDLGRERGFVTQLPRHACMLYEVK